MNKRLLVLTVDMADGDLIRRWGGEGHLPTLTRIIENGASSSLLSTSRILHNSGWGSFATGAHPGQHGVYFPYQCAPGRQFARFIPTDQYALPSFWLEAERQGCRTVIYDVPGVLPEREYKGPAIYDWGTWARLGPCHSTPSTLREELRRNFGPYPLSYDAMGLGAGKPDFSRMAAELIKSIQHKTASAVWLLGSYPWELALVGYGELHAAGHYFWPADDAGETPGIDTSKRLLEQYQTLDQCLGSLIQAVPGETEIAMVSTCGIQSNFTAQHLLPTVLERLGHTVKRWGKSKRTQSNVPKNGRSRNRLLPRRFRRAFADSLPWRLRNQLGLWRYAARVDWTNTRAFVLPTDLEGCIRINLSGREPQGIVRPGAEYDDLCERISDQLNRLTREDGSSVVEQVWRTRDCWDGRMQPHLPDLVVTWDKRAPHSRIQSTEVGEVEEEIVDCRTGTHSPWGFVLSGKKDMVPPGDRSGHIIDLAPTIFDFLGLHQPEHMTGKPFRAQQPPAPRR